MKKVWMYNCSTILLLFSLAWMAGSVGESSSSRSRRRRHYYYYTRTQHSHEESDHHRHTTTTTTKGGSRRTTAPCGQKDSSYQENEKIQTTVQAWLKSSHGRRYLMHRQQEQQNDDDDNTTTVIVRVPTVFHVIVQGRHGRDAIDRIPDQLNVLNDAFSIHGFIFDNVNITITDNSNWYYNVDLSSPSSESVERDMKQSLRQGGRETLNVYILDTGSSYNGWAWFPFWYDNNDNDNDNDDNDNDPIMDGIVLYNECLPGGSQIGSNLGKTLIHEVGHWLGLYHTFQGERCDDGLGDAIEDTPAQRYATYGCPDHDEDEVVDSCPLQAGFDPFDNYMDYSDDECKDTFTPMQSLRMHALWDIFRRRQNYNNDNTNNTTITTTSTLMNDNCASAIAIELRQDGGGTAESTVIGNTYGAAQENLDLVPTSCSSVTTEAGVWYSFQVSSSGSNKTVVLTTCDQTTFNNRITVFRNDCQALECVAAAAAAAAAVDNSNNSNSNSNNYCNSKNGTYLSFESSSSSQSDASVTYYALIHGQYPWERGDFALTVIVTSPPSNDDCIHATPIDMEGNSKVVIRGSTWGSTEENNLVPTDCDYLETGKGVWFSLTVGSNQVIQLSTCGQATFDTVIAVFEGNCQSLTCLMANDDGYNCDAGGSAVVFSSSSLQEKSTYFILAHGYYGATGNFNLTAVVDTPQSNQNCESAASLKFDDNNSELMVEGSTFGAPEIDYVFVPSNCDQVFTEKGMWYSLTVTETTDSLILLSTCNQTDFATKISVFENDCQDLKCVVAEETSAGCGFLGTKVEFGSTRNESVTYYILVHGYSDDAGNFNLSVATTDLPDGFYPANDDCIDAIAIEMNDSNQLTISGSTVHALPEKNMVFHVSCASTFVDSGVWYSLKINGKKLVTLSTCGQADFYDGIVVYKNGCENLECIAALEAPECDSFGTKLVFGSGDDESETYYILVHNNYGTSGNFELTVNVKPIPDNFYPANDDCPNAVPIEMEGMNETTISGSTLRSLEEDILTVPQSCFHVSTNRGTWYSLSITGTQIVSLSTCHQADFDTKISVFKNSCQDLECVYARDGSDLCGSLYTELTIESFSNDTVVYFILVHGYTGATGNFNLTIQSYSKPDDYYPPNDICSEAIDIDVDETDDIVVSGSTLRASGSTDHLTPYMCSNVFTETGVWYSLNVFGNTLVTLSTCDQADFDTKISVFKNGCENLQCVVAADDTPSCDWFSTEVSFVSNENVNHYLVLVHGTWGSMGNFNMTVTAKPVPDSYIPENDNCLHAEKIEMGESNQISIDGTITGALEEDAFSVPYHCSFVETGRGVWFSLAVAGTRLLKVSTCSGNSFGIRISVFTNECQYLECVAAIDESYFCAAEPELAFVSASSSTEPITYYILLHSDGSSTDNFTMSVSNEALPDGYFPSNDDCQQAIAIDMASSNEVIVNGNTKTSREEDFFIVPSICSSISTERGVWYSLEVTGERLITLSTCNQATSFDTRISVFANGCENLQCVAAMDQSDFCQSGETELVFQSRNTESVTYYILMQGFAGETGDFELTVSMEETGEGAYKGNHGPTISPSTSTTSSNDPAFAPKGDEPSISPSTEPREFVLPMTPSPQRLNNNRSINHTVHSLNPNSSGSNKVVNLITWVFQFAFSQFLLMAIGQSLLD